MEIFLKFYVNEPSQLAYFPNRIRHNSYPKILDQKSKLNLAKSFLEFELKFLKRHLFIFTLSNIGEIIIEN